MSSRHRSRHGGHPRAGVEAAPPPQVRATEVIVEVAEADLLVPPQADVGVVAAEVGVVAEPPQKPACTLAQLRRFIKSRPYVPLHELRRRFGIEGYEDEVNAFVTHVGPVYVGLPPAEAQLLGELVRGGEVGYEALLDPVSPAIVGVYPMRPVARP